MSKLIKDTIKSRQQYNRLIIEELAKRVEDNPTLRFGQLLVNEVLPDYTEYIGTTLENCIYNEESIKTLSRLGE